MVFCCVPNCKNSSKQQILHTIPKDDTLRRKWCVAIGREDLIEIDLTKRSRYRVCDIHFADTAKFAANRNRTNLKANSYPSMNLPDDPQPGSSKENFDVPSTMPENISMKRTGSPLSEPMPKVYRESTPEIQNVQVGHRTPTFPTGLRRKFRLLKHIGVNRHADLTPKASRLYKIAKNLRKTARRLDMHNIDAKKRIENALQYAESSEYLQTKVNETSVDFILSQLHLQNKQPKGRRFTIANKIFALSLLKQSAKAYKIFRQVFAVPSRKTLLNLLHQIPFNCGINAPILKSLSKCVSKMDISSRQCSLIFDEMAIEPSLTYSKKDDEVIGFVSTGDGKKLIFADHVMVFMLRGITRKWKQPIAYFFTSGAMNSNDLKRNIEEIIKEVHAIGLRIVATVCDQHPVNVTAVNKLYED